MNQDPARIPVRPTKLCLNDLGFAVPGAIPDIGTPLSALDHDLVKRAQQLPDELAAGGAERVRCLTDRVWLKVRFSERWRGAGTRLNDTELAAHQPSLDPPGRWWLGAAGWREKGSADDFYDRLEAAAIREGKGSGKASSEWLMPTDWDWKRLKAESGYAWVTQATTLVRQLIAQSIRTGHTRGAEFQTHCIEATVRADGREGAFLAITAEGIYNPSIVAVLLSAVPGVAVDDWLPEPGGVAGIEPQAGQVIWSTLLTPEQTAHLLSLDDSE
jgi:hypothetical protein